MTDLVAEIFEVTGGQTGYLKHIEGQPEPIQAGYWGDTEGVRDYLASIGGQFQLTAGPDEFSEQTTRTTDEDAPSRLKHHASVVKSNPYVFTVKIKEVDIN